MDKYITIALVVVSLVLTGLVLIQERDSGAGSVFGGGGGGGFYQRRRGLEKIVFISTIVFGVAFAALSILKLIY
ncbi:MAG: preprotein translocase subunit SecG [Candidatus Colwellbacteria bacterium RIFCSPHIGHO2_12_FULL_43_12]|uniref:Protein-export membrane protein SecG n=3 Tax=Candidatus Colwelliibacteriota TaxID=1817904 RepID=A0A1G1YYH1_9BACT|nr:MAG: preprotein translocase subunit SecG [Candidatus Colwellbacteria bacterium RIFCSPHIGHO2_02_FULL_43_15]OGY58223.1 MAG: preprotein translocase subunit SecG [Candidatus Colwellbacteria bacterium RIFCSPHIGHO2_12_FULL_43_12]OGY61014.1 MAG: preprotein translocase subunit SecG [Candidatus Colwellbacteria bacterium RIFCSPLOWO2_12_FULL_43_11]